MAQGQANPRLNLGRAQTRIVNENKVKRVNDFAFGQFLGWRNFFDELSSLQTQIVNSPDGKVELPTGVTADTETVGGNLALQIYMESLTAMKESTIGLAKLGLRNENKLWQLQN